MKKFKKIAALALSVCAVLSALSFAACSDSGNANNENGSDNGDIGTNVGDTGNQIVLKADTDFEALVSEQVDEVGWRKAFTVSEYGNCTVNCVEDDGYFCYNKIATENDAVKVDFYYGEDVAASDKSHEFHVFDGEKLASYMDMKQIGIKDGEGYITFDSITKEMLEQSSGVNDFEKTINWRILYVTCPDFSNFYSSFTYDGQAGGYLCTSKITTTAMFASGDYWYKRVLVKIINGRLAYLEVTDDNFSQIYFYDFGNTVVTLPEATEYTFDE